MAATLRMSRSVSVRTQVKPAASLKATVQKAAQFASVTVASVALAFAAHADTTVYLGSSSTGALVFEPATVTIKSGETVTFKNAAGFPHNIVFDEDAVPSGVSADKISHEDYLNAPGEEYSVKLTTAGSYGYYCEPHAGAGMKGTITVQ